MKYKPYYMQYQGDAKTAASPPHLLSLVHINKFLSLIVVRIDIDNNFSSISTPQKYVLYTSIIEKLFLKLFSIS